MIYWTIDIIKSLWTWISIAHRTYIIVYVIFSILLIYVLARSPTAMLLLLLL